MSKAKNRHAQALGSIGGQKGGPARARNLTPEQRTEIARAAACMRWHKSRKAAYAYDEKYQISQETFDVLWDEMKRLGIGRLRADVIGILDAWSEMNQTTELDDLLNERLIVASPPSSPHK